MNPNGPRPKSTDPLTLMFDGSVVVMLVIDPSNGDIVRANPAACSFYGFGESRLAGRSIFEINADPVELTRAAMTEAASGARNYFEVRHRLASGDIRDVEVATSRVEIDGRALIYSTVRDVTDRQAAETRVARLGGLTRGLAAAASELLRANSEQEIFDRIARAAVEIGGLKLAWVGVAEPGTRTVRLISVFGDDSGYLREIGVLETGVLPAALATTMALKTGAPSANNDLAADQSHPFRAAAVRHGISSVAAIPILAGHLVVGIMQCYAAEPGFFGEEELAILSQFTAGASARVAAIDRTHDHHQAQDDIVASEERYRSVFHTAPVGIIVVRNGEVEVNDTLLALFGYPNRKSIEEAGLMSIVLPEARPQIEAMHRPPAELGDAPTLLQTTGVRRDGSSFPILVEGARIEVDGAAGAIVFITDLSAMEAAENVGQMARARYQMLVKSAPLAVISMDDDYTVRSWNPAAEHIFGWSAAEALGRPFPGGISARGRKELERLQRHGGAGQPAYETSRKRRDGSALDLRFWSNPIHDVDGRPAGFLVLAEDVTREQHLAQERARLATAIDQTADSVVVADSKAHILYVNPAFERVTGYTRDEVLGKNPRILQSGTMPRSFYDDMWAVLSAGRTWVGEFANRRKDGSIFPEEATISPISDEKGYVTGYVAVGRDLTVQRQADAARRESEKGYRSLFDNMHEGVAYCEMTYVDGQPDDFTYLDVNRAFSEQTGLDDVIGKRVSEVVPGIRESDPELLEAYGRVAAGGRSEHFENHVPPLDMWLAVSVYCPEPGRFIAVFDVITERVKAEHALRAANTLLERTEAIAHVGSWRLDVSSGSVSWSAEMYRIFGLDPSEPALTATEILARAIHPDDRHIMAAAQGAFGIGEVRPLDLRIVLPGGEVRVVHMDGEVQNDDQGRPVALFGFAQDVTASRHS